MKHNVNNPTRLKTRLELQLLGLFVVIYVVFYLYLTIGLKFEMMRSDVLTYWKQSLSWQTPFDLQWVPGYSLTIALIRGLTFNFFPPIAIMIIISGLSYLIGIYAFYQFVVYMRSPYSKHLVFLFALYPFVGLTYSVYPIADSLAIALLLLSILSLAKQRYKSFVFFAGLAMLVHKLMWVFVPPLMLGAFLTDKKSRAWLPLAFIPVALWIVAGMFHYMDVLWFIRWSIGTSVASRGALPILDGVITPLISGSIIKIAKGLIVVITFIMTLVLCFYTLQKKYWIGLCISLSVILACFFVNSYDIWAAVRFSRLLVIPLVLALPEFFKFLDNRKISANSWRTKAVLLFLGIMLLISQFAYGYYMAKIFFN